MTSHDFVPERLAHAMGHADDARNALANDNAPSGVLNLVDVTRDLVYPCDGFPVYVEQARNSLRKVADYARDHPEILRNVQQAIDALDAILAKIA